MVWDIYRPVSVSVFPKIDKRPDWTGLLNTSNVPNTKKVPHWAHFLVLADGEVTNIKNVAPMATFFMLGELESS